MVSRVAVMIMKLQSMMMEKMKLLIEQNVPKSESSPLLLGINDFFCSKVGNVILDFLNNFLQKRC